MTILSSTMTTTRTTPKKAANNKQSTTAATTTKRETTRTATPDINSEQKNILQTNNKCAETRNFGGNGMAMKENHTSIL